MLLLLAGAPVVSCSVPLHAERPEQAPPGSTQTPEGAPPSSRPEDKPAESSKDPLSPAQRDRLRRAGNLGAQMRVFSEVSQQYVNMLRAAAADEDATRIKDAAASLATVFQQADAHMRQSPEKKKYRHLKKFEIALREQISILKSLQLSCTYTLHEVFAAPIEAGERARKDALGFIFEGGNIKKS